ncbi:uncharacterized protein A4U43_C08F17540 [Asparagus officinalis]|nr:uncharacterized protein A4U43_C08F17540 [Asparagus officinalis]
MGKNNGDACSARHPHGNPRRRLSRAWCQGAVLEECVGATPSAPRATVRAQQAATAAVALGNAVGYESRAIWLLDWTAQPVPSPWPGIKRAAGWPKDGRADAVLHRASVRPAISAAAVCGPGFVSLGEPRHRALRPTPAPQSRAVATVVDYLSCWRRSSGFCVAPCEE